MLFNGFFFENILQKKITFFFRSARTMGRFGISTSGKAQKVLSVYEFDNFVHLKSESLLMKSPLLPIIDNLY
jgi:hypothetical protein